MNNLRRLVLECLWRSNLIFDTRMDDFRENGVWAS